MGLILCFGGERSEAERTTGCAGGAGRAGGSAMPSKSPTGGRRKVTHVRIREVGPRDGFQNEPEVIATPDKVRLIDMLARTGLRRLEVTSFVRPDVIPQLADAAEVLDAIDPPDDLSLSVL